MGKKRTRTTYSKQYKFDVIQQSYQRNNIKELADELGIRPELIYRWRKEYEKDESGSFPGQGVARQSSDEEKMARMERELAEARMERDILKKAIGIFSKRNG